MNEINQVFGGCVVSRELWPPRLPDFNLSFSCVGKNERQSVCMGDKGPDVGGSTDI
jgi:hypothetical protein